MEAWPVSALINAHPLLAGDNRKFQQIRFTNTLQEALRSFLWPSLQTDLIIGLLLPLRLSLAIAQKINHKGTKAQKCLLISLINLHIEDRTLCVFVTLWF